LLNDECKKVSWVGKNWQSCYSPFRLDTQVELFGVVGVDTVTLKVISLVGNIQVLQLRAQGKVAFER